jgi:NAD(P)-dependent dehydrogenase (short-subunit alcohol dehydrogenase family)
MAFQCNVLAPTLLALLLLPKVKAAAAALPKSTEGATVDERTFPVISFVNSVAHNEVVDADVPRDQTLVQRINDKMRFDNVKQYFLVKLAGWYAMRGVAERVGDARAERVVVNASCPGLCKTNMLNGTPLLTRIIMAITYFIMGRTAEQGARTMISATALGPESHGRFWTNDTYPP